jgi:hypothetical protein
MSAIVPASHMAVSRQASWTRVKPSRPSRTMVKYCATTGPLEREKFSANVAVVPPR